MAFFYNQKEFQRDVFAQSQINSIGDTPTNFKLAIFLLLRFTSARLLDPSPKTKFHTFFSRIR